MSKREEYRWQLAKGGCCKTCFVRRVNRPTFAYCVKRRGQWEIVVRRGVQVVLCVLCYVRIWDTTKDARTFADN